MAKMRDILRPKPKMDPAELAQAQARMATRLADLFGGGATEAGDEQPSDEVELDDGVTGPVIPEWPGGRRPPIVVEGQGDLVPVMAEPREADLVPVMADSRPPVGVDWARVVDWAPPDDRGTGQAPTRSPDERAPATRARRQPATRAHRAPSARPPIALPPCCPYCATILRPPRAASRRCPECLHRIVVRHVDDRAVYLTESAVEIFEAERRRIASTGRWTRERQRWLKLAATVGAPAQRVARLEASRLSQDVVDASRALYLTTVDRSFSAARRERRWEDASRIRREQALALHRIAGSPSPPPAEAVALLREGATAELKGIAKLARDAELVGPACCDACRVDHGQLFRIATELRAPRLPHEGCPRGLCRCRWALAVRDRTTVARYLRRRPRSGLRVAEAGPSPSA